MHQKSLIILAVHAGKLLANYTQDKYGQDILYQLDASLSGKIFAANKLCARYAGKLQQPGYHILGFSLYYQ